jgi:hypothetical protein
MAKDKDKDKVIHFPLRKFETMTEPELDAVLRRLVNHIVNDIDDPIPLHIMLLKTFRWPTESLRKRILRKLVKTSIAGFMENEVEKMNKPVKRK